MLVPFILALVAAWLFFHFYAKHRGSAPVRPLIPIIAAAFVLLLGLWGAVTDWSGETDPLPFVFGGLILPALSMFLGIWYRKPLLCGVVGAALGLLFTVPSMVLGAARGMLPFVIGYVVAGFLLGSGAAAFAKARAHVPE